MLMTYSYLILVICLILTYEQNSKVSHDFNLTFDKNLYCNSIFVYPLLQTSMYTVCKLMVRNWPKNQLCVSVDCLARCILWYIPEDLFSCIILISNSDIHVNLCLKLIPFLFYFSIFFIIFTFWYKTSFRLRVIKTSPPSLVKNNMFRARVLLDFEVVVKKSRFPLQMTNERVC